MPFNKDKFIGLFIYVIDGEHCVQWTLGTFSFESFGRKSCSFLVSRVYCCAKQVIANAHVPSEFRVLSTKTNVSIYALHGAHKHAPFSFPWYLKWPWFMYVCSPSIKMLHFSLSNTLSDSAQAGPLYTWLCATVTIKWKTNTTLGFPSRWKP